MIMHGNPAFLEAFGAHAIGQPAREALIGLPPKAFELMDLVFATGKPGACQVTTAAGPRRLVVVPRRDPETGETYGVTTHLRAHDRLTRPREEPRAMAVEVTTDYPMFIDGVPTPSLGGRWIEVRSPATRELVGRVPDGTEADVDRAVAAARRAFRDGRWARKPLAERVTVMNRLGDLLDRDADELARLETLQTGTTYKLRRDSDFAFASDNLRFFATQIRNLEGKAAYEYTGTHTSFVRREPIGVVGQVSPWNYPLWMAIWKIGPALAAGNSIVLKPASATPLTTVRLAELALEAGVPAGVFNVVTGRGDVVGAALAAHMDVDMISLTGDTETGKRIQALAAGNLKRVHLELGGKAPFIVCADADLEAAARGATAGALINGGQDCTAATRAYVHRSLYDAFLTRTADLFDGVRVGDPFDPTTDMGTLISEAQVERADGFVKRAVSAGARVVTGGIRPKVPGLPNGAFYRPDAHRRLHAGQRDRPGRGLWAGARGVAIRHRRGSDRDGERHSLRARGVDLDARRVRRDGGGACPELRPCPGQRPPDGDLGDAARRVQAVGQRQGHVDLFVRGIHPGQARHARAHGRARETVALHDLRGKARRLASSQRQAQRGRTNPGPSLTHRRAARLGRWGLRSRTVPRR